MMAIKVIITVHSSKAGHYCGSFRPFRNTSKHLELLSSPPDKVKTREQREAL